MPAWGEQGRTGEGMQDTSSLAALLLHAGGPPALGADDIGGLVEGPAGLAGDGVERFVKGTGLLGGRRDVVRGSIVEGRARADGGRRGVGRRLLVVESLGLVAVEGVGSHVGWRVALLCSAKRFGVETGSLGVMRGGGSLVSESSSSATTPAYYKALARGRAPFSAAMTGVVQGLPVLGEMDRVTSDEDARPRDVTVNAKAEGDGRGLCQPGSLAVGRRPTSRCSREPMWPSGLRPPSSFATRRRQRVEPLSQSLSRDV